MGQVVEHGLMANTLNSCFRREAPISYDNHAVDENSTLHVDHHHEPYGSHGDHGFVLRVSLNTST